MHAKTFVINRLTKDRQMGVVAFLVEGNSIRATVLMTGAAKNTVVKLPNDLGCACASYYNRHVRNLRGRVQITTDGHRAYLDAVEGAFGMDCDYAQLQKIYGASMEPERQYSPARCIGCDMKVVSGNPDPMGAALGDAG